MKDIDKTFSDLLKANIALEEVDLQLEDSIMKQVQQRSLVEERLKRIRSRILLILKIATALLIVMLVSLARYEAVDVSGDYDVFRWGMMLLGVGLFYFLLTMRLALGKGRTIE